MTATVRSRTSTTLAKPAVSKARKQASRKATSITTATIAPNTTSPNIKTMPTTTPSQPRPHPLSIPNPQSPNLSKTLHRLQTHPSLTPHQRKVYLTLLSIPPGHWTTYAALAKHLHSSPRAIGNAMRANPFAPDVPCHRVLASDGTVGGYKGKWGNGGEYAEEKMGLLRGEGVVFDERGRAAGKCWVEWGGV
ncbi:hypothetical protein AJ79_09344 [Helicocarpus griseus UAMH5409]|uniref:Methylated-DNA--protein-cysteine methyltransferase n=1 Tax=Helicocarpus griseus UAMH5409 TaxID=1447875 RepID=A0A2B7WKN6_9EURO|nr:hypothetical protein AJ79_09344 [Helicocarpus griseus UAMH5409]